MDNLQNTYKKDFESEIKITNQCNISCYSLYPKCFEINGRKITISYERSSTSVKSTL